MKTVSERLDAIEKEIDKIEQILRRLSGQRALLHTYLPLSNMPVNEEVQIRHDPTTSWLEFCFLEGAIIYHAENYAKLVRKLLENQRLMDKYLPIREDICQMSIDKNIANKISYEFDSFILKFFQTIENPIIEDIKIATKRANAQKEFEFLQAKRNKNDIDSLYWYINLLRIPAAHSTEARYTKSYYAGRFMGMSSKAEVLDFTQESISLPCLTLIDLRKSQYIKEKIQHELIDNKECRKSILDVLFPNKSKSGYGKIPFSILPRGFEPFDLLTGFCKLICESGKYLESINKIYYENMGKHANVEGNLIYGQDDKGGDLIATKELFL